MDTPLPTANDDLSTIAVTGGFRNPVMDAQRVFRAVMDAFAAPGTIGNLGALVEAPSRIQPAAAALLAALSDDDAPVFLEAADPQLAAWLAFQTGAAVTGEPDDAAFAVLAPGSDPAGWSRFPLGTHRDPDRGTTLVLPVDGLKGGAPLRLRGPGIERERIVAPLGLPAGFRAARAANHALFPRGHDLVLVCGTELMALPRTTRIEEL